MTAAVYDDAGEAVADIPDGATVLISGFGAPGQPMTLVEALIDNGTTDLTVVSNNAGNGEVGIAQLIKQRRVRKVICSYPRQVDSWHFDECYRSGELELELVPQGNLAERIRAAGAGIGAFFTPTAYGTPLAEGKETRIIDGVGQVLEFPIKAEFALVGADVADRSGNLLYHKTARNFGPIMATAATTTVVEVREVVETGAIDPEVVVTPGIFVDRIFTPNPPA
ncbi:3-oxoacid CoA-transferase subunit A [Demetria terragena]|uniref:3-oxoacid CoA-transferase subunit A n=1 Tax=Demetria terragena TaxID=63959 RepID=UPI00037F4D5F|nr:3-oxoacid CoA-transferase subunit A [Demetria terragena]